MNEADQQTALREIVAGIIDTVMDAEPHGVPAGPLFAVLHELGCSLAQFDGIMASLITLDILKRSGHVYRVSYGGRVLGLARRKSAQ